MSILEEQAKYCMDPMGYNSFNICQAVEHWQNFYTGKEGLFCGMLEKCRAEATVNPTCMEVLMTRF